MILQHTIPSLKNLSTEDRCLIRLSWNMSGLCSRTLESIVNKCKWNCWCLSNIGQLIPVFSLGIETSSEDFCSKNSTYSCVSWPPTRHKYLVNRLTYRCKPVKSQKCLSAHLDSLDKGCAVHARELWKTMQMKQYFRPLSWHSYSSLLRSASEYYITIKYTHTVLASIT